MAKLTGAIVLCPVRLIDLCFELLSAELAVLRKPRIAHRCLRVDMTRAQAQQHHRKKKLPLGHDKPCSPDLALANQSRYEREKTFS